jgi:predicted Zn-dependent peptidase
MMSKQIDAIQVTTLPSGLIVVTETMDRVETVSFGAYVASGTRHEAAEENGVSHFLEHMAFKGTETRSASAIAEEIEAVGGHINAYTAREQTAFYVKVLKEDMALGADIIGDILTHSTFDPDELERERGVILQEIGQANDTPDDIVFDHFQETAYPDQPMGRPVLGTEALIRGMKRDTLMRYMRSHYTTGNTVIAAAGKLEHAHVLDLVQRHFADLPTSILCSASRRSPISIRIITRRLCCPRCWAAACRRACSRKSAKSAGWFIRFTVSPPRISMAGCLAFMPALGKARRRN